MPTLLLRLAGPMQSWGTTSRFDERDTHLEPSKSGVLGLICAALGRDRSQPLDDLAALRMGVRVDREGLLMRDYHTATGVMTAAGKRDAHRTVVSPRFYLSDAAFLVGLSDNNAESLNSIRTAIRTPVWPLALGRKAFPPGVPIFLDNDLVDATLRDALLHAPRIAEQRREHRGDPLRFILEDEQFGSVRLDQPVAPFSERRFGPRFIVSEVVHVPE